MTNFWMERAEAYAIQACEAAPKDKRLARILAEILVGLDRNEEATSIVDRLNDHNNLADLAIRAEIAFAQRDFTEIDNIARAFMDQHASVPAWIEALTGRKSKNARHGMFEEIE